MTDETRLRDQIAQVGASLFERGLTAGSSGNISVRLADGGWLMTPTNISLGAIDPAKLSHFDPSGTMIAGDPPTKEAFLHFAMYGERPSAGAVVHLHSTHATAISILRDVDPHDVLPALTAYYIMRVGRLPLVPYFAPGDPALADAVRTLAGQHHAVLLANHGPLVSGINLANAQFAIEELEETARLFLMLHGHAIRPLTSAQIIDLSTRFPK
ncbi:MAG: 3-oxo-tetronate 4-phosphate decarboxylase [Paracoccaceae bacterium]